MKYCTTEDVEYYIKLSEEEKLVVEKYIEMASEEMNLYLYKQYALPLPYIPLTLRDVCAKLSCYCLYMRYENITEIVKQNRNNAIRVLELIALGKLDIGA